MTKSPKKSAVTAQTTRSAHANVTGGGTLPPEQLADLTNLARQHAHKVLKKIPLLGPVAWLMMQQAAGRNTLLGDMERRVLPALLLDQAKLYMKDEAPVAFASWAKLSTEVAQRYQAAPHQLGLTDWNSGDHIWLIDVFTPYGGAQEVLKDLRENVFAGRIVRQLIPGAPAQVMAWPAIPVKEVSLSDLPKSHQQRSNKG